MTSSTLAWLTLAASVLAEVLGTLALRHADGLSRPWPTLAVLVCYGCAIWWMSLAVRHLEVGLAYAVWAGCGTALTALVGIAWHGEAATWLRLGGLALIVVGVVALNLGARH